MYRQEVRLTGLLCAHDWLSAITWTLAREARILEWSLKRTRPEGAAPWSTRSLGTQRTASHKMVTKVWSKHGLGAQRLNRILTIHGLEFSTECCRHRWWVSDTTQ